MKIKIAYTLEIRFKKLIKQKKLLIFKDKLN